MQAAGEAAPVFATAAPRFDAKWLIIAACVALTLYLGVVPLAFLLWQSFFTPQTAAKAAVFTFGNYREAYGSADTWLLFGNSLRFATGAAALSFCIGTLLAWMNERTNTPFKGLFFALSVIPLIIPGILFTVAWILLGSPRSASSTWCCSGSSTPMRCSSTSTRSAAWSGSMACTTRRSRFS